MDRYQENYTYPFGSLRDHQKATEIVEILKNQGIPVRIDHEPTADEYILSCSKKEDVEQARTVFLKVLGLLKPEFVPDPSYDAIRKIPISPITYFLIALSVVVYGLTFVFDKEIVYKFLFISNEPKFFFKEVSGGEFYRLLTPIFLHFNFMHVLFNLLWLKDLGKIIENHLGKMKFSLLIISLALSSNLLQYYFKGPLFGGMSGVVYGLLGFLWMAKLFNEDEQLIGLPKRDIYIMIGWFVACLTGLMGPIANLAHGMGLFLGMIVGMWPLAIKKVKWLLISFALIGMTIVVELIKSKGVIYGQFFQ